MERKSIDTSRERKIDSIERDRLDRERDQYVVYQEILIRIRSIDTYILSRDIDIFYQERSIRIRPIDTYTIDTYILSIKRD